MAACTQHHDQITAPLIRPMVRLRTAQHSPRPALFPCYPVERHEQSFAFPVLGKASHALGALNRSRHYRIDPMPSPHSTASTRVSISTLALAAQARLYATAKPVARKCYNHRSWLAEIHARTACTLIAQQIGIITPGHSLTSRARGWKTRLPRNEI
jgi:hypothetical protein